MHKKILTISVLIIVFIFLSSESFSAGFLTTESARSSEVSAVSDRTPPPVPRGLQLTLDGNGVKAIWQPSSSEPPASYRLYRSNNIITTTSGLTPVAAAITLTAVDPSPTTSQRYYAVTALDALGNESLPSDTIEITFPVAPVKNLILTRTDEAKPTLTWEASESNIQGYVIYRNGSRINQTPTISTTYTDGYYYGGVVKYGISEINNLNDESPVKEVLLPDLSIGLKQGTTLRRGALETVTIVANAPSLPLFSKEGDGGSLRIDSINLKIGSLPENALSGPFTLNSTTPLEINKVAATEANAPSQVAVPVTAILYPSPGATIKITKTSVANVIASSSALEIYNEPLVRGTAAKVRLKVNNLGSAKMEFLTSQNSGATTQVKISLKDQDGNLLSQGNLDQRTGSLIVNSGNYATARLMPGESILTDPITFTVPSSAPFKVFIEADIQNTYYHYNQTDQVTAPGLKQTIETTITETSYRATATTDKTVYRQGETIKITGRAISNTVASELPMPSVPVKLGISVKGFDRYFTINTDDKGNFTYNFIPGSNEAGTYSVWAVHPDLTDRTVQAQFNIIGLDINPEFANIKMAKNSSFDIPVTLKNLGDTSLTALTFNITESAGITAGIINSGDTTLTANETRNMTFRITADSTAPDNGYATLAVEGTVPVYGEAGQGGVEQGLSPLSASLTADITLVQAIPIISTTPSYIDAGLVRGTQRLASFTITNTGLDTLKNARLEGPSTSWMQLTNDKNIGDIKPGASTTIGIMLKPSETIPQNIYDDRIVIYSDNHIPYTFNIQVTVTSNAIGNVLFDVLNELNEDVSGATITLQHQLLTELMYTIKTGADGTVSLFDIPEGRYTYNVTAAGHLPYSGTFTIYPGITATVPIAMEVTLIDIQWSVVPITIEDRYEIKITQTFETNVPTSVIITEPAGITLPNMQPGEVYNGEFTITNYGFIAADYKGINFPQSFDDYDIEVLANIPDRINAMQKIVVPYRITKRQIVGWAAPTETPYVSLLTEVRGYGGGGCGSASITTNWEQTICPNTANARTTSKTSSHTISYSGPGCGGGVGYTGGGGSSYIGGTGGGGGGQGGGGYLPGGSPTTIASEQCFSPAGGSGAAGGDNGNPGAPPSPGPDNNNKDTGCGGDKGGKCEPCIDCPGSSVIITNGTYEFSAIDLKIPARGMDIELRRTYRSNRIIEKATGPVFAEPEDGPLGYGWTTPYTVKITNGDTFVDADGRYFTFKKDANGNFLTDTSSGMTLRYTSNPLSGNVTTGAGFELKTLDSFTRTFDANGKLLTKTDNFGNTWTMVYDTGGNLIKVKDASNRDALIFTYDTNNHITQATDLANRTINYEYDSFGNLIKVTDPAGNIFTYAYNSYHGITSKTNPLNETYSIEYQYPDKGIVNKVTDPVGTELIKQGKSATGHETIYQYDFNNKTFYVTDKNNRTIKKTVNDKGKPTSEEDTTNATLRKIEYLDNRVEKTTDELGNITIEQKDEWGNTIRKVDGEGNETRYTYTTGNRLTSITYPDGRVDRYEYDSKGNVTKEALAAGSNAELVTTYTYDQYGQLTSTTKGGAATTYAYDDAGNRTGITDPMGNTTTTTYDLAGNLLAITTPLIGTTTYSNYNTYGKPEKITDPNGNIIVYTYDALGRVLTTTNQADNSKTENVYVTPSATCASCGGGIGSIDYIILPEGNKIDYDYDKTDNLIKITDNKGNSINYTYDIKGNKTKEEIKDTSGALQKALNYQYDVINRLTKLINPDSTYTEFGYDKNGNRAMLKNPKGNLTSYAYDNLNRIIKTIQPRNTITTYTYDTRGNLTGVTDANGNVTTYEYDNLGRNTKTVSPDTGTTIYTYDKNNNMTTKTDANGITITYQYDAINRVTKIDFLTDADVTYIYDNCINGKGRLCAMTDASGTTRYEYTAKGQIAKETKVIDGASYITQYSYDMNGNFKTMTYPSGRVITYTYSNDRAVSVLNNVANLATNITYKPFGGVSSLTYGNGIIGNISYDTQYRITALTAGTAGTILNYSYIFDANGNITGITNNLDPAKNKTFAYDALDRLAEATQGTVPVYGEAVQGGVEQGLSPYTINYTYDGVGNRQTQIDNAGTATYSYTANKLTAMSGTESKSFVYDNNGNTATENSRNYIYNQNQRLIKVTEGGITKGEYTYNGNGQRVKKTTDSGTVIFHYNLQGQLIAESDNTGSVTAEYVFLNGAPLAKIENSNVYYYHNDHLGTPQRMTDSSGAVVWSAEYKPFGEATITTSTVTNNLRFPGQYYDGETGKHYNYYRDYDPNIGRYVESDPIGLGGGINLYTYVRNNPVNKIDEKGLDVTICPIPYKHRDDVPPDYDFLLNKYPIVKTPEIDIDIAPFVDIDHINPSNPKDEPITNITGGIQITIPFNMFSK